MTPEKRMQIITAALMSFSMALLFSGAFTWWRFGFSYEWLKAWLAGFAISWPASMILAMAIGGPIRHVAMKLAFR